MSEVNSVKKDVKSEKKEFKSLKNLRRKKEVTLGGFGVPVTFNLIYPTRKREKIDLEVRSDRTFKLYDGKLGGNKEESRQKAYQLMADLIYTYSDLSERDFEIDGDIYKIEDAETLYEVSRPLELMDFFTSLSADEATKDKMLTVSSQQKAK